MASSSSTEVLAVLENGLVRTSTKKFFRKWKPVKITLLRDRLMCHYQQDHEDHPPQIIPFQPNMRVSNVFEQKNGSLLEEKRHSLVYFCRLVIEHLENVGVGEDDGSGTHKKSSSESIGPSPFLDENQTDTILKFGCNQMEELVNFTKCLDGLLTSSPTWDATGRREHGDSEAFDEEIITRDVGRQYRGSVSESPNHRNSVRKFISKAVSSVTASPTIQHNKKHSTKTEVTDNEELNNNPITLGGKTYEVTSPSLLAKREIETTLKSDHTMSKDTIYDPF